MASGTVVYIPPNGGNVIQTGQGVPGTSVQPAGMVQYVQYLQYGGQQLGSSSNPPQQNRQAGLLEKLLKVETKTLGAIQIIIGLVHIGFGAVSLVLLGPYYFIPLAALGGYPFWGGIFYIASGSLSVSAEKHLTSALVKSSVGMNIISALAASTGIILYVSELVFNYGPYSYDHSHGYQYDYQHIHQHDYLDEYPQEDLTVDYSAFEFLPPAKLHKTSVGTGLSVLLFLFTLLELCITVSAAHFGCQAVCCKSDQPTVVFVPYAASGANVVPTEDNSDSPPSAYDATVSYSKGE